jgi:hypothetical protein
MEVATSDKRNLVLYLQARLGPTRAGCIILLESEFKGIAFVCKE